MLSDSDEDKLLQMALKEQAQRDLNYGKSSSNSRKPVANYVQPPSSQPKKLAPPATAKHSQGKSRVVDDDDDSKVEMLSISSGDEDIAKDLVTASRNLDSGRAPARDDDRTWDDEEPSSWKYVNEAEGAVVVGLKRAIALTSNRCQDIEGIPSEQLDSKQGSGHVTCRVLEFECDRRICPGLVKVVCSYVKEMLQLSLVKNYSGVTTTGLWEDDKFATKSLPFKKKIFTCSKRHGVDD